MKFLVPNYSFLQNPRLEGYRPQTPVLSVLSPQLNLLNPPPRTKFLGTPLKWDIVIQTFGFSVLHSAAQHYMNLARGIYTRQSLQYHCFKGMNTFHMVLNRYSEIFCNITHKY